MEGETCMDDQRFNAWTQETTPAAPSAGTPAPVVGETFVGQTPDPNTFVTVVAAPAAEIAGLCTFTIEAEATSSLLELAQTRGDG